MIASMANEKVRRVLRLREKRGRQQHQQFAVEGAREIHKALAFGFELIYLLVNEHVQHSSKEAELVLQMANGRLSWQVSDEVFRQLAVRDEKDGLIAVFRLRHRSVDDLKVGKNSFFVAVDGVEKPGNLGAILRTADGAGVDGVFLLGEAVDLFNPNVIRASLGTVFSVPVVRLTHDNFIKFLAEQQLRLYGLSPEAKHPYFKCSWSDKATVALFGSEAFGISENLRKRVDELVQIPMQGAVDSLNLSVSVALIAYERLRQAQQSA